MQTFLYVLRAARLEMLTEGPDEKELAVILQHEAYLDELTNKGLVLLYGRTQNNDPTTMGLVVFEAENGVAALDIMRKDPAVAEGIMTAELFPYKVTYMR